MYRITKFDLLSTKSKNEISTQTIKTCIDEVKIIIKANINDEFKIFFENNNIPFIQRYNFNPSSTAVTDPNDNTALKKHIIIRDYAYNNYIFSKELSGFFAELKDGKMPVTYGEGQKAYIYIINLKRSNGDIKLNIYILNAYEWSGGLVERKANILYERIPVENDVVYDMSTAANVKIFPVDTITSYVDYTNALSAPNTAFNAQEGQKNILFGNTWGEHIANKSIEVRDMESFNSDKKSELNIKVSVEFFRFKNENQLIIAMFSVLCVVFFSIGILLQLFYNKILNDKFTFSAVLNEYITNGRLYTASVCFLMAFLCMTVAIILGTNTTLLDAAEISKIDTIITIVCVFCMLFVIFIFAFLKFGMTESVRISKGAYLHMLIVIGIFVAILVTYHAKKSDYFAFCSCEMNGCEQVNLLN